VSLSVFLDPRLRARRDCLTGWCSMSAKLQGCCQVFLCFVSVFCGRESFGLRSLVLL